MFSFPFCVPEIEDFSAGDFWSTHPQTFPMFVRLNRQETAGTHGGPQHYRQDLALVLLDKAFDIAADGRIGGHYLAFLNVIRIVL